MVARMASRYIFSPCLYSSLVFSWALSTVAAEDSTQGASFSTLSTVKVKPTPSTHTLSPLSLVVPTASVFVSNNNASCPSFESLNAIYEFQKQTNLTWSQISRCQGACKLAYGTGNADLAGIGVFVSYIALLAFSALFGPILRIASFLTGAHDCTVRRCISSENHNYTKVQYFVKSWDELQRSFLDAQACFVIPAIIASFIELNNHPPIYEISFIDDLGMALCTSLLICTLALHERMTFQALEHSRNRLLLWKQRFYGIFSFSLLFILPFVCPMFMSEDLWNLGRECNKVHKWQDLGFGLYYHFGRLKDKIAIWIVLGLVFAIYGAIPVLIWWKKKRVHSEEDQRNLSRYRQELQSNLAVVVGTGMAIFWSYHLFMIRGNMSDVMGSADEERSFNYGQIIAIFIWVPLMIDIAHHLIGYKKWINGDHTSLPTTTSGSALSSQPPKALDNAHLQYRNLLHELSNRYSGAATTRG